MQYASFIDTIGSLIDLFGVLAIVFGIIYTFLNFINESFKHGESPNSYKLFRQGLGRTIIIGLELLIAGDIVRSIALPPSFTDVGILAIIVIIRAFLSIQIEKGSEIQLPWHRKKE